MGAKLEPLRGTCDIWEPEAGEWVQLEAAARDVFGRYGYGELRTPIMERTDVFVRSIGGDTEVVQKEMYTFADRGGRSLTLRPEGTAGVMRAIANQGLAEGEERRVHYCGPMFRGERPAAGRQRQFHQIGVEAVGREAPAMDAECIAMLLHFLREIAVSDTRVLLNSRGTVADREPVGAALAAHFRPQLGAMCEDCRRRLETNVWRILDCKRPECQDAIGQAPAITDLLSEPSRHFFEQVCGDLDALGVDYQLDPRLVRGLDYYEHTVFEIISEGENLGAQNAIAGGGRYRIALPGLKRPICGVGFAAGVERLLLARGGPALPPRGLGRIEVYVAVVGEAARAEGLRVADRLRQAGVRILMEVEGRSLKAQLRSANKVGASVVLIVGEAELATGSVVCRSMADSSQEQVPVGEAVTWVKRQLAT